MFENKLIEMGIDPKIYLEIAKKKALENNYDPKYLKFSTNPKKKLSYNDISFGASGYNDFIIYSLLEPFKAESKRKNYWRRASKVAIQSDNKYSPSMLALHILW